MIIREVEMENIRSYEHEKIRFPKGTILFEGDIGSGKTTILMAIEFALFGASTKYDNLLRKGAQEGYVRIKFEVNGGEYEIYRSLVKRGKSIRNEESYVINPGGKKRYLKSDEIRSYALRLMGLEVSGKKRKSLPIVTYAIYTPQEEMKKILEGEDEERLEVIRKIFKLDEYRIARDNVDIVVSNIDSETKAAKSVEEEIERLMDELRNLKDELGEKEKERARLEREKRIGERNLRDARKDFEYWDEKRKRYHEIEKNLARLRAVMEKANSEKERLENELREMERDEREIADLKKHADEYEKLKECVEKIEKKIKMMQNIEREYTKIDERISTYTKEIESRKEIEERLGQLKRRVDELSREIDSIGDVENKRKKIEEMSREVYGKLRTLQEKLREKEEERKTLESLGAVCPTCKRPLSSKEKIALLDRNRVDMENIRKDIEEIKREVDEVEKRREEIYKDELRKRKLEIERAEVEETIKMLRKSIEELRKKEEEIKRLTKRRNELRSQLGSLQTLRDDYERTQSEMKLLESKWRRYIVLKEKVKRKDDIEKMLDALRNEIAHIARNIDSLENEMKNLNYSEEMYEKVRRKYQSLEVELAKIDESLRSVMRDLERTNRKIGEKDKLIGDLRKKVEIARKLESIRAWIDGKFRDALENIEKNRLARINEEFRMLFEEWFHELLGESDYSATVDENFRPIVRYENYDMPISTLSGGERTSVALSYRLALNTMVKRALGLKNNILILDEPTDGFSKDQLFKLKDILEKMDTDQIIIVSHEKELRNVADTVFLVEKREGASRISVISR